ncbi:hypothetical protein GCM10027212_37210 [Actinotalea caeni]
MNPLIVSAVAVVIALVVVLVLVRRHLPESGLGSWLRESFRGVRPGREIAAIREESARLAEPTAETGDLRVSDILELAEPGEAYHRPVDLREVVSGRRGR